MQLPMRPMSQTLVASDAPTHAGARTRSSTSTSTTADGLRLARLSHCGVVKERRDGHAVRICGREVLSCQVVGPSGMACPASVRWRRTYTNTSSSRIVRRL